MNLRNWSSGGRLFSFAEDNIDTSDRIKLETEAFGA